MIISILKYLSVTAVVAAVTFSYADAKRLPDKRFSLSIASGVPSNSVARQAMFYGNSFYTFAPFFYSFPQGGIVDTGDYFLEHYKNPEAMVPVAFNFMYSVKNWLHVGMNVGFAGFSADAYSADIPSLGKKRAFVVELLPELRFTYLNRPWVRLYSSVSFGAGLYFDNAFHDDRLIRPQAQLTLFGISVGKTVFGFAEAGVGNLNTLLRGGLGYRF